MKIGVLALQGAFIEHKEILIQLGANVCEIRRAETLRECDGLILPGGETTTQRKLAQRYGLWDSIQQLGRKGMPIFATCAGLILLANKIDGQEGMSLNLLDIDVLRNAYGRQVFSFEAPIAVPHLESSSQPAPLFPAIFIRAPRIVRTGASVSVLGTYKKEPAALKQGNILALAFHPELTHDNRFHQYFLDIVRKT